MTEGLRANDDFGPIGFQLSEDDQLWVANLPISNILAVYMNPVYWALTAGEKKHVLVEPFCLTMDVIKYDPEKERGHRPPDLIAQGIDYTNILSLRTLGNAYSLLNRVWSGQNPVITASVDFLGVKGLSKVAVKVLTDLRTRYQTLDEVKGFYDKVKIEVTYCENEDGEGRAFVHFPVWEPSRSQYQGKDQRAERIVERQFYICVFQLICTSFKGMLEEFLKNGKQAEPCRIPIRQGTIDRSARFPNDPPPITTVNHHMPTRYLGSVLDDDNAACEMLVARYLSGDKCVTYEEAYSKPYHSLTPSNRVGCCNWAASLWRSKNQERVGF